MKTNSRNSICISLLIALVASLTLLSTRMRADTGTCGGASVTLPFTDVPGANVFFCSIAEAFFSGLSNGTTPTTYNPGDPVPREQMAAFVARTMDQSLKRGSRRASLKQFWTPTSPDGITSTTVGTGPDLVECDGADLWVTNNGSDTVSRVRASDGKLLETWTGAISADGVLAAKGMIFVTGNTDPARSIKSIRRNRLVRSQRWPSLPDRFPRVYLSTARASGLQTTAPQDPYLLLH